MKTFFTTFTIFLQALSFSAFAFDADLIGARTLIINGTESENKLLTVTGTESARLFKASLQTFKGRAVFHLPMGVTGDINVCNETTCKKISLPPQFGGGRNS